MTRYIYKKEHIDKDDPTDTVSIPADAIKVDVKYGAHDIQGHVSVQWLEPDPIAKKAEEDARWKAQHDEWDRVYPFKRQCMDALSEHWNKTHHQQDAIHDLRICPPQCQEDVDDFISLYGLCAHDEAEEPTRSPSDAGGYGTFGPTDRFKSAIWFICIVAAAILTALGISTYN
ncbi:MAG: hypothetical protein KAJ03_01850 [Gammaproteobacteria bacterium]|nr:hypothetical protein [Gammaproteobacteria bacterium]